MLAVKLRRSGLGSNVSIWLGPPCMNRGMTLFAVAGNAGGLEPGTRPGCAAAVPCKMSSAASQPMPSADVCRNLRRESSVDINQLTHVEHQKTKPRQGISLQIIKRGLRSSSEGRVRTPIASRFRPSLRILAGLLSDSGGELLRLCLSELAVHQRQGLGRYRGRLAPRATRRRIRRVEI